LCKSRKNPPINVQTARALMPSSPASEEPPAPIKPRFSEEDIRALDQVGRGKPDRGAKNGHHSTTSTVPSPYSGGTDAPPQPPYIAPAYTPTSPPRPY
jgi:hypothetical protein